MYSSWSNYKSSTFVLSSTVAQELLQREAYNNVCLVQACLLFPAARLMRDLNVSYACPQLCRQTDSCVCVRACAVCPLCYACTSVPGVVYIVVIGPHIHRETSLITSTACLKLPQSIRPHETPWAVVSQILCQHILYVNSDTAVVACQFWKTCNGASMYHTILTYSMEQSPS